MISLKTAYHQSQIAGKINLLVMAKASITFDKNVKTYTYIYIYF